MDNKIQEAKMLFQIRKGRRGWMGENQQPLKNQEMKWLGLL